MSNTYNLEQSVKTIGTQITMLNEELAKFNLMYTNTPGESQMNMKIAKQEMALSTISANLNKLLVELRTLTFIVR